MKSIGSFPPLYRVLALILTGCLNLSACSQPMPATGSLWPAHSRPSASANPNRVQSLRVIVTFRQTVPHHELTYLEGLGKKIHASVRYISSVSPDTHVYRVDTQPGQNSTDILKLLGDVPEVLSVEADAVIQPF